MIKTFKKSSRTKRVWPTTIDSNELFNTYLFVVCLCRCKQNLFAIFFVASNFYLLNKRKVLKVIRLRIRCYLQILVLGNLILHPVLTNKNLLSLSKNMIYVVQGCFRGIEMYLEQALKNAMTRVDSCIQVLGLKIVQKIHSLPT